MKILIIEDDSSIRNVLRIGLESKAFAIDLAEDGERGSFMARTNNYDLIILDNVLPKKTGGHICKEIRDLEIYTPILMLSAKSEVLCKIELLNLGADDYMTKPFSFDELLARIYALIRRPKYIQNEIINVNNLKLDRRKQTIYYDDKELTLTKKEFSLLEYLIVNKNTVLSRGQILDNVWDLRSDPFSNTIETHIRNVRVKIKDEAKKIIESIHGRGYRLNAH
jgi:two-component system, OmpR family, response regulator ArlR